MDMLQSRCSLMPQTIIQKFSRCFKNNRFNQESIELPLFAKTVYLLILNNEWRATVEDKQLGWGGSQYWDKVRKGLDWFRRHFAKQYMVLLD